VLSKVFWANSQKYNGIKMREAYEGNNVNGKAKALE
jgi:hypothetical protein